MTQHVCLVCAAEIGDGYVCVRCTFDYDEALRIAAITYDTATGRVHCLLDELETMLSRQARMTQGTGGARSSERPLPFDNRASDALDRITRAVMDAYRVTMRRRDSQLVIGPRFAARLLRNDLTDLLRKPECARMILALHEANASALAVIDRPPDRWYAGQCSALVDVSNAAPQGICLFDLYAMPDAVTVTCAVCGTVHNVEQRRSTLLTAAEDVLATATEIARAVALFGEEISAARIHTWSARKRLTQRGVNTAGQPLYRVGDVIAIARARAVRQPSPGSRRKPPAPPRQRERPDDTP